MIHLSILSVALMSALAAALPGSVLVIQKKSLLSDALSHSVLPGIVLAYLIFQDLQSPWLILGAGIMGIVLVWGVEALENTGLVKADAALGLVFPGLFAIGILLISQNFSGAHLDEDVVLVGSITAAPLDRFLVSGLDLGPRSFWVMLVMFLMNGFYMLIFHKEIKIASFDAPVAAQMGLRPRLVLYGFMILTSLTMVGAFDSVGAILVVAFFIAPGATATLFTRGYGQTLLVSLVVALVAVLLGYFAAWLLDTQTSGTMAVVLGLVFLLAAVLAPEKGWLANNQRKRKQKISFSLRILLGHLEHHGQGGEKSPELEPRHLEFHLRWPRDFARKILQRALKQSLVENRGGYLYPTAQGREFLTQKGGV